MFCVVLNGLGEVGLVWGVTQFVSATWILVCLFGGLRLIVIVLVTCCWLAMGCLFVCFICVLLCICRLVGFGLWVGLFYCGCWF